MNCPKCSTPNSAAQYYCIACGTSLNATAGENTPASKPKKSGLSKTKMIWIVVGAVVFLPQCLFALGAKEYPAVAGYALLLTIGLIPAIWFVRRINHLLVNASKRDLWFYRISFVVVSLFAWPILILSWLLFSFIFAIRGENRELHTLKSVVVLSGALVVTILVLAGFGQVYTAIDTQNRKNNLNAQQEELSALKKKWGDYAGLCAQPNQSKKVLSNSQIKLSPQMDNTILVIDNSYPHTIVSPWENKLPSNLQATKPDQVAWLVCKNITEFDFSCDYEAGTKIKYKMQRMAVEVYAAQSQQLIKEWTIQGSSVDKCPEKVHTVNSGIDYVTMKDGSQRKLSDLQLDQNVSFEGFYSTLNDAIAKASK